MKPIALVFLIATFMETTSCHEQPHAAQQAGAATDTSYTKGTFGYDLLFLQKKDPGLVVLQQGDAQLLVSPRYQAKVFTSTAAGSQGQSFGWIHYQAFDGPEDAHMNGYGGENRIWLGPEGGRFSLFFAKGAKMEFDNWHTPKAFDTEAWQLVAQKADSVVMEKSMQLTNYAGHAFSLSVRRLVKLLDNSGIDNALHLVRDSSVKAVGYYTENSMTNTGTETWTATTGMPCIWMLDMFNPSPATTIVIPYKAGKPKPATTDYFGEIPADRIRYHDDKVLFFKADGKSRGKLGIHPSRVQPVAGSYDASHQVLTIILFDTDPLGRYLNQEWSTGKEPFSGDAMNAYNDGPLADGSQMGPFYELESVSPAAFLPPGHTHTHRHSVFHFTGNVAGLDRISQQVLGVKLETVQQAF
ncbi:hypothetical protein DCC81_21600 [Chitinophaga parva]|uniref:Uncharacterized protein n=2 Tax=Chitinophaga parva TaxID=2169414 RepID=A0A2T7BD52_9BACT|nr:hypothetical protein DCC81_21600 [Chitinophaga parva]